MWTSQCRCAAAWQLRWGWVSGLAQSCRLVLCQASHCRHRDRSILPVACRTPGSKRCSELAGCRHCLYPCMGVHRAGTQVGVVERCQRLLPARHCPQHKPPAHGRLAGAIRLQVCPGDIKMPMLHVLREDRWLCGTQQIWGHIEAAHPNTPDLGRWGCRRSVERCGGLNNPCPATPRLEAQDERASDWFAALPRCRPAQELPGGPVIGQVAPGCVCGVGHLAAETGGSAHMGGRAPQRHRAGAWQ